MEKELRLVQQKIDIDRFRGITMKDILAFDLVENSFLFEMKKHLSLTIRVSLQYVLKPS